MENSSGSQLPQQAQVTFTINPKLHHQQVQLLDGRAASLL